MRNNTTHAAMVGGVAGMAATVAFIATLNTDTAHKIEQKFAHRKLTAAERTELAARKTEDQLRAAARTARRREVTDRARREFRTELASTPGKGLDEFTVVELLAEIAAAKAALRDTDATDWSEQATTHRLARRTQLAALRAEFDWREDYEHRKHLPLADRERLASAWSYVHSCDDEIAPIPPVPSVLVVDVNG
jgi:hypothetical protein